MAQSALEQLRQSLGDAAVITDLAEREFYSQDVYNQGSTCLGVIRPESIDALKSALRIAHLAGLSVVARGGGLSYTDAYLPTREDSLVVDTSRLDRIVEINEQDRYVVVECGCTWAKLHEALRERGLRTPYFGPLSGLRATVGGALSQGSIFLGSARYGSVGDALLGLEVLRADGEALRTGAWGAAGTAPFFRYFGPDLSGLFVGDAGALGVKVRASLRLLPMHPHADYLSVESADFEQLASLMSDWTRAGLASECFAFDPMLARKRMQRQSLMADVKSLGQVIKAQGMLEGLKVVAAGRSFLDVERWSAHISVEADSAAELKARMEHARKLIGTRGKEVENTIPKVLRSMPFTPPNNMLGPRGERWVPVHGILPHTQAATAWRAVEEVFARHKAAMGAEGVEVGYLMTTIAQQGFLLEPVFYWPDAQMPYHQRMVEADYLARVQNFPARPSAKALVDQLKREVADCLRAVGATHFQIGKFYTWREGRDPAALALFDAIKQSVDPHGRLNPGALQR